MASLLKSEEIARPSRTQVARSGNDLRSPIETEAVDTDAIQYRAVTREELDAVFVSESECFVVPWTRELIHTEFERDISFVSGLFYRDNLIAHAIARHVADELHVLTFGVRREFRGQGLGRHLLKRVIESVREKGARYATLEVRVSNTVAQRLYQSLGFRIVGMRKRYYCDNGEDALILARSIE